MSERISLGLAILSSLRLSDTSGISVVSRKEWGARPPLSVQRVHLPFPNVIIHHSKRVGKPCTSKDSCIISMTKIQDFHMNKRHWADIAYNFLIGGDGDIFEGRGWKVKGSHAGPSYNYNSLGICAVGDFNNILPSRKQLDAIHELMQYGVQKGFIEESYKLYGHRNVINTTCPGDAFYAEIEKWPHKTLP